MGKPAGKAKTATFMHPYSTAIHSSGFIASCAHISSRCSKFACASNRPGTSPKVPEKHHASPQMTFDCEFERASQGQQGTPSAIAESEVSKSEKSQPEREEDDLLISESIDLVKRWLLISGQRLQSKDKEVAKRLAALTSNKVALDFVMRFVDRVARSDSVSSGAEQLKHLGMSVDGRAMTFLHPVDQLLFRVGATIAPFLPYIVVPLAKQRMRALVGHLVLDADPEKLAKHLRVSKSQGYSQNVNLLGEAVLGEGEAERRFRKSLNMLEQPDVDYVSVKVSAFTSQINRWDFEGTVSLVEDRLCEIFRQAQRVSPPTFVNLDMEEYQDLELTLVSFTRILDRSEFLKLDAGIVLQAYLPDAFPALRRLVVWSNARHSRGGGQIKIRLVKGANLAMEAVTARLRGWKQATYESKAETDANYIRCLQWLLTPDNTRSVRVGIGSHNLFTLAYARLLSLQRGVSHRVGFEMLQGMAPGEANAILRDTSSMLLYTPVVSASDFDVSISYLFRRLEENAGGDNFLKALFHLHPDSMAFNTEASRFRNSVKNRNKPTLTTRRAQSRPAYAAYANSHHSSLDEFCNEPDTDPVLRSNRLWAIHLSDARQFVSRRLDELNSIDDVCQALQMGAEGFAAWRSHTAKTRRDILRRVADEISRHRGELINAMIHEGSKTLAEADPEVSEAIDFATYYGGRTMDLPRNFRQFGTVCVASPWNYPVAIASGGVLASLAAGNAVILKPSLETPCCARILAECAWKAGVPKNVLQCVSVPENEVGKHLIANADAVILTGASSTAGMFRGWKPDINLFAETSGKNSMIVTPNADIDLAVQDIITSAFGHTGQKCSAVSLCICVGDIATSERFARQLRDAAESLKVGSSSSMKTNMGPLIMEPNERLYRALTTLDDGESWILKPTLLEPDGDQRLWSPGIKTGVRRQSWFHLTECFGPVLGIMHAQDLAEAVKMQNDVEFGLTGGLHSLDPSEIDFWLKHVEVGNAYVNRTTTGAIVRRQPFGGWKQSVYGPGAKTGGPNYVRRLGWVDDSEVPRDEKWLQGAIESDVVAWEKEFSVEHDPSNLKFEQNIFRYLPCTQIGIRVGPNANEIEVRRVQAAIARCGVPHATWSFASRGDDLDDLVDVIHRQKIRRMRVIGDLETEFMSLVAPLNVHVERSPVVADGRQELLNYLLEQTISRTMHRFGNIYDSI